MAHSYLPVDRDQQFLLPPDVRDWLPAGHLAWFVIDVVATSDTSALHARHPNDGVGRRAYDPDMMLALLLYSYCLGERSSRQIERLCETDTAYRVISANRGPDHSTIARFRQDHEAAMPGLFMDVLMVCARAGLASVGVVALDGTKIAADASLAANRSEANIAAQIEEMLAAAAEADRVEDEQFGSARGDELPAGFDRYGQDRLDRLQACWAQLEAQREAELAERAAAERRADEAAAKGQKVPGPKRGDADPVREAERDVVRARAKAAKRRVQRAKVEQAAAAKGRRPTRAASDFDAPVRAAEAAAEAAREAAAEAAAAGESDQSTEGTAAGVSRQPQANVTDPDSRIMKTRNGWLQGFNAQAVVNEHQIVLSAELTNDQNDVAQYDPMIRAAHANLEAVGITEPIGIVLADAGYCSEANLTSKGPDRLIATLKDHKQRAVARQAGTTTGPAPADASPIDAMEHRLRTPEGSALYARRSVIVEPIFGQIKTNRRTNRFMRRGIDANASEWQLITAAHNLLKAFNTGYRPS